MSAQVDNGVWGGVNITQAALQIESAISSPTCRATETCQVFVKTEIPECLQLNGAASCWCSPDSPLLDCAECMVNPTDDTTTFQQTQSATEGVAAYKTGCQAYAASLSGSSTTLPSSTLIASSTSSSQLPTISIPSKVGGTQLSTGAISGIVSGSVSVLCLCIFIGYIWHTQSQNRRRIAPLAPIIVPQHPGPQAHELVGPIRVMTRASGTRIDLSGGPDEIPEMPQMPPRARRPSRPTEYQV